jgi:hypothetical protein
VGLVVECSDCRVSLAGCRRLEALVSMAMLAMTNQLTNAS